MKLSITKRTKIFLVIVCFALSTFGFLLKLPASFRGYDKEFHTAYYFIAAAFFNILFSNKNLPVHLLIFGCLYLFGVCIEHAQAYSNTLFQKRIHGRYDPEDVKANLEGLIAFSAIWVVYVGVVFFAGKAEKS